VAMFDDERTALGLARIEAHYFIHGSFMADGALLEGIDAIRHLPATIVQGRYDMVCPICTADALHRAWPEADYVVVPDSGHSALEPGTCAALIAATEAFRARTPDAAA
jgi:proline iminopeptidase